MLALNRSRRGQRGQAIVLVAGGMIAFLAILALIFDGGRIYAERRRAQNAADAAALAGARVLDSSQVAATYVAAQQAACAAAAANGFGSGFVDATCGPSGSVVQIRIPTSPDGTTRPVNPQVVTKYDTTAGYVEVAVVSTFQTFFGGIVGLPQASAAAFGVAVNIPNVGTPYTLMVLNPTGPCGTFNLNGGGGGSPTTLTVSGGGVYVASAGAKNAVCKNANAATMTSKSLLTTIGNTNQVVGGGDLGATPPWITGVPFAPDPLLSVKVPPYPSSSHPIVCGTAAIPSSTCASSASPLPPGVYYGGISATTGTITLAGGTYILSGGGLVIGGNANLVAAGPITIILTADSACSKPLCSFPSGTMGQNGSGFFGSPTSALVAQTTASNPSLEPYLNGILVYIDRDVPTCSGAGNTTFQFGGAGTFYIAAGSIAYAPCSTVNLVGNGLSTGGAVLAYNVNVSGGKALDLLGPGVGGAAPAQSSLVQ